MKRVVIILVLLFPLLIGMSQGRVRWQSGWRPTFRAQLWDNWCVHACTEMYFTVEQCEGVNRWLRYYGLSNNPKCCTPHPSLQRPEGLCAIRAGVPKSVILEYLSSSYSAVSGRYAKLWTFMASEPPVAFVSSIFSSTAHLSVLAECEMINGTTQTWVTIHDPGLSAPYTQVTFSNLDLII